MASYTLLMQAQNSTASVRQYTLCCIQYLGFKLFLFTAGNPQLESIDLTGCRNLMSFSSSSTALTELEAASCSRLYSLTLASSNLITLQLQNCAQLAEVYVPALVGSSSGAKQDSTNSRAKSATGKGLSVNGCSALSADAKVRLAMSVSAL